MHSRRMHLLSPCGSAFQRAEVLRSINRHRNKRVIVLIVEEAADDFVGADIQKANPLIRFCMEWNSHIKKNPNLTTTSIQIQQKIN